MEPGYCHFCMKFLFLVCGMAQLLECVLYSLCSSPPSCFSVNGKWVWAALWLLMTLLKPTGWRLMEKDLAYEERGTFKSFFFFVLSLLALFLHFKDFSFPNSSDIPWYLLGKIRFSNRSRAAKMKNGNYHNSMGLLPQHCQPLNSQPHRAALCLSMRR